MQRLAARARRIARRRRSDRRAELGARARRAQRWRCVERGQRLSRRACGALSPERERCRDVVRVRARNPAPTRSVRVTPIATADYPTPARRPAYGVLDSSRFARTFGFALPDWRTIAAASACARLRNRRPLCRSTDGSSVRVGDGARCARWTKRPARACLSSCTNCNRQSSLPFALYRIADSGVRASLDKARVPRRVVHDESSLGARARASCSRRR